MAHRLANSFFVPPSLLLLPHHQRKTGAPILFLPVHPKKEKIL
jgi:hypothetical protein